MRVGIAIVVLLAVGVAARADVKEDVGNGAMAGATALMGGDAEGV